MPVKAKKPKKHTFNWRFTLEAVGAKVTYSDGTISIEFADGSGQEFPNLAAVENYIQPIEDPEIAKRLLVAAWRRSNPNMNNAEYFVGRKATVDASALIIAKIE